MDAYNLYKQIKKGVRESKKYGKVYSYIYMSEGTLKMLETVMGFTERASDSFNSICGLTICIDNDIPKGRVWVTNEPLYFPKEDSQQKQPPE